MIRNKCFWHLQHGWYFYRFLFNREVLKCWSNKTFSWKCICQGRALILEFWKIIFYNVTFYYFFFTLSRSTGRLCTKIKTNNCTIDDPHTNVRRHCQKFILFAKAENQNKNFRLKWKIRNSEIKIHANFKLKIQNSKFKIQSPKFEIQNSKFRNLKFKIRWIWRYIPIYVLYIL